MNADNILLVWYKIPLVYCDAHRATVHTRLAITNTAGETATAERCRECKSEADRAERERRVAEHPAEVRAALVSPKLSHTRATRGGGVAIYHRDDTSPTGVFLATDCASALFEATVAQLRAEGVQLFSGSVSPLSPTEGR